MWRPSDLFWLVLTLATVAAILFWEGPRGDRRNDSYSAYAEGKKALVLLLETLGADVRRNDDSLTRLASRLRPGDTVCFFGSARSPRAAEWNALERWVSGGGRVVIGLPSSGDWPPIGGQELAVAFRSESIDDQRKLPLTTTLPVSGHFAWRSRHEFEIEEVEVLVRQNASVQAVRIPVGSGEVIVTASDWIFTNLGLAIADNPLLALELLGEIDQGTIYVDESLNMTGTPKIVALLFQPPLNLLTLTLVLAIVLYGWWESHRFGPIEHRRDLAQQNLVEHVRAVGSLYWKSRAGKPLLRRYWNWFARQWHLSRSSDRQIARLARRAGMPPEQVQALIARVRGVIDGEGEPSRRTVAGLIRQLAEVHADALAYGETPARGEVRR